jgi:hypothetical protein
MLAGFEGDFHELLVPGHAYTDRYGVDFWVLRQLPRIVEHMLGPAALACCSGGFPMCVADCRYTESRQAGQCRYMR